MKRLILCSLLLASPTFANDLGGDSLARSLTSAHSSYQTAARIQQMQSSQLSGLMDELYRKTQQSKALGAYNPAAATLKFEMSQLVTRINETSAVFNTSNMRVRADSAQLIEVVEARRQQYYQRVQSVSGLDSASIKAMGLPVEVQRDVKFFKSIEGFPLEDRKKSLAIYRGTQFGEAITGHKPGDLERLKGLKNSGEIKIDTYHTTKKFEIARGNVIQLQTVDGAIFRGTIWGVLPDGRVLVNPILPDHITSYIPSTAAGRIINLSDAKHLMVYPDISKLPTKDRAGQPDLELDVRFSNRQLNEGAKSKTLSLSAMRSPINGSYATRHQLTAGSIDRRAGEMINNLGGMHDASALGMH